MIIECQNCNKKFDIKDTLIPSKGRLVQCGFCHSKWRQLPNIEQSYTQKKIIDEVSLPKEEAKPQPLIKKKKIKNLNKIKSNTHHKEKNIGFFSYIFLFLISIVALFLLLETFKYQINNIFPNFDKYIIYVYETLDNILILIKDLFKSY